MALEWSATSQEMGSARTTGATSTTIQKGEAQTTTTSSQVPATVACSSSSATKSNFNRYPSAATPSSTSTLLQRSPDEPTRSKLKFADDSGKILAVVEFSDSLHYSPTKAPVEPSKCSPGLCCAIA